MSGRRLCERSRGVQLQPLQDWLQGVSGQAALRGWGSITTCLVLLPSSRTALLSNCESTVVFVLCGDNVLRIITVHTVPTPPVCVCVCVSLSDVDECQSQALCVNGVCVNSEGSFSCISCPPGYTVSADGELCQGASLHIHWGGGS